MSDSDTVKPSDTDKKEENPFVSPNPKADVVLVVEGRKLHVSKLVLSLTSPVFEAMFERECKAAETSLDEIPLPEKKYDDMVEFLLCVYPSTQRLVTLKNLDTLLALAQEYQVQALKDRCEQSIITNRLRRDCPVLTNEQLVHLLYLSDWYKLKAIIESLLNIVRERQITGKTETSHGKPISLCDDFTRMSANAISKVLMARLCNVGK